MGLLFENEKEILEQKDLSKYEESLAEVENYLALAEAMTKKKFPMISSIYDERVKILVTIAELIQREYHALNMYENNEIG